MQSIGGVVEIAGGLRVVIRGSFAVVVTTENLIIKKPNQLT